MGGITEPTSSDARIAPSSTLVEFRGEPRPRMARADDSAQFSQGSIERQLRLIQPRLKRSAMPDEPALSRPGFRSHYEIPRVAYRGRGRRSREERRPHPVQPAFVITTWVAASPGTCSVTS